MEHIMNKYLLFNIMCMTGLSMTNASTPLQTISIKHNDIEIVCTIDKIKTQKTTLEELGYNSKDSKYKTTIFSHLALVNRGEKIKPFNINSLKLKRINIIGNKI